MHEQILEQKISYLIFKHCYITSNTHPVNQIEKNKNKSNYKNPISPWDKEHLRELNLTANLTIHS